MLFLSRPAPQTLPQHLDVIVGIIRNVLGDHTRQHAANAALLGYVFSRILLMLAAFTKIADRAAAGMSVSPRPCRADLAPPQAEEGKQPVWRKSPTPPLFRLPRAKGWLLRLVPSHHLAACGPYVAILCAKPEMTALLEVSPQVVRMMRRLYRMLTPDPYPTQLRRPHEPSEPDSIRRPPRPRAPDGTLLPTLEQFRRAERRGKPYRNLVEAWGRIMTYTQYIQEREYRLAVEKFC